MLSWVPCYNSYQIGQTRLRTFSLRPIIWTQSFFSSYVGFRSPIPSVCHLTPIIILAMACERLTSYLYLSFPVEDGLSLLQGTFDFASLVTFLKDQPNIDVDLETVSELYLYGLVGSSTSAKESAFGIRFPSYGLSFGPPAKLLAWKRYAVPYSSSEPCMISRWLSRMKIALGKPTNSPQWRQ